MTVNAVIETPIDDALQEEAAAVLATMGLTVSDAVRLLLIRIAREHALPFDPLIPNAETVEAMLEARRGNLESAATIEQFMEAMDAKD